MLPTTSKALLQNLSVDFNYVPLDALQIDPFFRKESISSHLKGIHRSTNKSGFFFWIVVSDAWNKKQFRKDFEDRLQGSFSTAILFFLPEGDPFESFAMAIVGLEGARDFARIVASKPDESFVKIWTAIHDGTLTSDSIGFESKASNEAFKVMGKDLARILGDASALKEKFQEAGHDILDDFILPKDDAPLLDIVLHVSDAQASLMAIRSSMLKHKISASWIISINGFHVSYFKDMDTLANIDLAAERKSKKDRDEDPAISWLESIVAVISRRSAFNEATFAIQYGDRSIIYHHALKKLCSMFESRRNTIDVIFKEWQMRFQQVYKKGVTDQALFIKHSYLNILIRLTIYVAYFPDKEFDENSLFEMTTWLEDRGFSLFTHDFFYWSLQEFDVIRILFQGMRPRTAKGEEIVRVFETDDLFKTIYQQMVSTDARHALGEFYTPSELAASMVDDAYTFGQVVLDPACGSGTFLVETIRKIRSSLEPIDKQLQALQSVYGFDVNPIAVATARANVVLHMKDLLVTYDNLSVNVYLCNSLFPVEISQNKQLDYGKVYIYKLPSIDLQIGICDAFFTTHLDEFKKLLEQLDAKMMKHYHPLSGEKEKAKNAVLAEMQPLVVAYPWMKDTVGVNKHLADNFFDMVELFLNLADKDKNHIWTYLLYQQLGAIKINNIVDLVIGNPPWLIMRNIYNVHYKEDLKELAKKQGIYVDAEQVATLENSALFLYGSKVFLKNNGRVFFVVSNAFLAGDNHAATRRFIEFQDVEGWVFLDDVFRIHNICLSCVYRKDFVRNKTQLENLTVKIKRFDVLKLDSGKIRLDLIATEFRKPYTIFPNQTVGKLTSDEISLKLGINPYNKLFFQGGSLVPRNLIFVETIEDTGEFYSLKPVLSMPKEPWTFNPVIELKMDSLLIEKPYIFKILKSLSVVPFLYLYLDEAFLPIEIINNRISQMQNNQSAAWNYYQNIDTLYRNHIKEGASSNVDILWKRLNYQKCLSNAMQLAPFKVVMQRSGTLCKAFVVAEPCIIDFTCYYFGTENQDEAYYLSGFLNAPALIQCIQIVQSEGAHGSGRDIAKRPFQFAFPRFDKQNPRHLSLARKALEMEKKSRIIFEEWKSEELEKLARSKKHSLFQIKPQTIQNRIYSKLGFDTKTLQASDDFAELNALLLSIIEHEMHRQVKLVR